MSLQRYLERLIWWCMLPLMGLGLVLVLLHLRTLEERRQMLVDSVVRAAAGSLDQMIEVRLNSLALLGRMLDEPHHLRNGQLDLVQAHEFSMAYLRQQGHHVVISSANGDMLINTRVPFGQALPPIPEESLRSGVMVALLKQAPALSEPFIGPIAGVPVVTIAVPLTLPHAQPLVLLTSLETQQLRDRMTKEFQLPTGWLLRVQTQAGSPVFSVPEGVSEGVSDGASDGAWVGRPAKWGEGQWRAAVLNRAPWTTALLAPRTSPLDHAPVRALLLLGTLCVGVGLVYAVAHCAAARLNQSISCLTQPSASPVAAIDIHEVVQVKAELMRLDRERLAAQEDERRRIGLELHDDLQQKLALARQDLAGLASEPHRDRAMSWVDESIASTRRLVLDLRPPMLSEMGLPAALAALSRQHQQAHGQAVDLLAPYGDHWLELPEASALALYRIAQEALNNILKHAQAQAIHISLSGTPGGDAVLEVVDDGVGFHHDARARSQGHGLRGMHERAHILGGRLEVTTAPGDGTVLLVRLPWTLTHGNQG